MRAMKDINSGEEITSSFVDLKQNKSERNKDRKRQLLEECNCDKCRLNLDKDFDYSRFEDLWYIHRRQWMSMGVIQLNYLTNRNYIMNIDLIADLRQIYGENHPYLSEVLVLSFICFTKNSEDSNIYLVTLWYQKITKLVAITHGKAHPLYKLVTDLNSVYS